MSALLDVILPVFLLIGAGFAAAKYGALSAAAIDGIMTYAQSFALPVLLFRAIAALDLSAAYDLGLMASFYIGAFCAFAIVFAAARWGFGVSLPEAVAAGFAGYFSNSLLLGVPITERAFGADALAGNFAIISIHAPLLYTFGIIAMVMAQAKGAAAKGALPLARTALRSIISQPLVIGILCGFAVNLSNFPMPGFADSATEMMARSGIPAALFGLGGVLLRYRPEGELRLITVVVIAALIVHPAITYVLARGVFQVDTDALRSATLTAAMAPGVSAYMFAHLFGIGRRVAASAVLIGTAGALVSVWVWLQILS